MDADEAKREKARRELRKNVTSYIKHILEASIPKNNSCAATYLLSLKPSR